MKPCLHIRGIRGEHHSGVKIHECAVKDYCTLENIGLRKVDNSGPLAYCEDKITGEVCDKYTSEVINGSSKYCYLTITDRVADISLAITMIKSARKVGELAEFHAFAPMDVKGAVNHRLSIAPWNSFMRKIDILREMKEVDAEFIISVDTDNYFIRHPDFIPLIRDNPYWIQMEGLFNGVTDKDKDWWGPKTPEIINEYRNYGVKGNVYNTNGGLFIVRRDFIDEFCDSAFDIFNNLKPKWKDCTEEHPLAVLGNLLDDKELNTVQLTGWTWLSDWDGAYRDSIPTGNIRNWKIWHTGEMFRANPAIIHAMRSKSPLRELSKGCHDKWKIGDTMENMLNRFGISKALVEKKLGDCGCSARQKMLNTIGAKLYEVSVGRLTKDQFENEIS